jgi:RND family efflux transporter MFP subunit
MIPLKVKELKAAIAVRRAERADAELRRVKSEIRAPFDGRVYDKNIEISQVVQAGQTVGILVDTSVWEIPVDMNVENIDHFNIGNPVKKSCAVFRDTKDSGSSRWEGYISRIEKINETSRTVRVVVEVPGNSPHTEIAKGMFCRVVLPGKRYKDKIALPLAALRNNDQVYLVEKGRLQIKTIDILERTDREVVIGSGISEGEKVIVSDISNPVPGMRLQARQVTEDDT